MAHLSFPARAIAPRRGLLLALVLLAAGMGSASAQSGSGQRITPNFKDADITQIIEAVGMATGKNFIIDPRVRAQVTMLSSTPMTPDEFYQAFLAILQVHGFVAVPSGEVIKIVPDANMRQYPSEDLPSHISSSSDAVVTQVLAVKNLNAAQLVPVLRPLMPQNAQLSAVTGTNILIISDHANNVNRIMRIVARIDEVGNPDFDVMALTSAAAGDTARVLNSLLSQSEGGANVRIVADDRSNSIIVSGDPATRLRVKTLVAQLDSPVETGTATQVRYLLYSDAQDLSTRLKEQMGGRQTGANGQQPRQFGVQPIPNAQGNTMQAGATPTSATQAGPATISLAGGEATIWADKDTNALVMTADPRTMRALNVVIDKLDIRRPQVLVQAIIADVAVDRTLDLGINWAIDGSSSSLGVGGFISPVAGTSILDLYNDVKGGGTATTTNAPTGATIGIGRLKASGVNFALMLRALQGDAHTNIIATPSVVTRDNQEAKMEVAQEVPFLTGQYSTTNGTGQAFQTIQQEDVGTLMTVTPTISAGDVVLLKLNVESSSISSSASGVGGNPITNKNTIATSVLIKDGGTLVLGGLIQDSVSNSEQSIPYLGKIPLLGELFRTRNNQKTKSDFLIFLQPRIMRDDVQATLETDAKYNYMMNEQRQNAHDKSLLPLAPYMPADPMPPLIDGHTTSMFGTAAPISPRAPVLLHPIEPPAKGSGADAAPPGAAPHAPPAAPPAPTPAPAAPSAAPPGPTQ
jgi:general secretion pathway protein D